MTLYYSLTFLLLVVEMAIFIALIIPLPFTARRKLFTFISESKLIAKLQYGMKITFIFILILFLDSVNRVYRVQLELSQVTKDGGRGGAAVIGGPERQEVQSRKFYSQRNMYLCGFTLFLSLILNRTYTLILEQLRLEEELKRFKGDKSVSSKGSSALANAGNPGEIGQLKSELEAKDRDMANLKKQVEGLQREYGRMGDQVTNKDSTPKKDR